MNQPVLVLDKTRGAFELYTDEGWKKFSLTEESDLLSSFIWVYSGNVSRRFNAMEKNGQYEVGSDMWNYMLLAIMSADGKKFEKMFRWLLDAVPTLKQAKDALSSA